MKLVHGIHIRVFITPEESETKIVEGLHWLVPFDFEKEKIRIKCESAVVFEGKKISILSFTLLKEKHTNIFLRTLVERLGVLQCSIICNQKESRLDEALHFFIRLDKQGVLNKKAELTDTGKCFHIMFTIAAFPAKQSVALTVVEKIFKPQLQP